MSSEQPPHGADETASEASDTARHYAETIYYIRFEEGRVRPSRLAAWLGVSAPTVSITLQRLARDGWVEIAEDRSVSLTDKGERLAEGVVRVHRLLERWLTDALGLDWTTADAEAQNLAPGVTDVVAERMDATLGRPSTCPHGNIIPGRQPPYGELLPLTDLQPGERAVIRRISEVAEHDAPELLRELDRLGLRTGVTISGDARQTAADFARYVWVERLT